MYQLLKTRIRQLADANPTLLWQQRGYGIEKESLRVNSEGKISQQPHPALLGSSLTHPYITTDYSEALLELITPPLNSAQKALDFLKDTHQYVYDNLENEILWGTSMPCIVSGEKSIPIAYYGTSNQGLMKTIYRRGLGYRYGRMMQVIAGIHFNYSFSSAFWSELQRLENNHDTTRDYINARYFDLIRNLQRYGWIIPYLFGASPAVCRSFIDGPAVGLEVYDESTYFQPYATSLRMGDIGYQNYKEGKTGIKANYDNIDTYIDSLTHAITEPYPDYQAIGVKVDNEYRQLNANILQIENEYYSSVRPKQITTIDEKPSLALKRRGVRYVELRSLDINVFEPMGISLSQLYFLEIFMLFCLLTDSPRIDHAERREIDINQSSTAHRGREPGLLLHRNGQALTLRDWAQELSENMQPIAELLDATQNDTAYRSSLSEHSAAILDPALTPSAIMLASMSANGESFHNFSMRQSRLHHAYFSKQSLPQKRRQFFKALAEESKQEQRKLEQNSVLPFDSYLQAYFDQS